MRTMKTGRVKKGLLTLLALCMAGAFSLGMSGCSGSGEAREIDIDAAVQAVLASGGFSEELVSQDDTVIGKSYPTLDLEKVEAYSCNVSGSMGTPEEISIFKAKTAEDAASVRQAAQRRIEDQRLNFEDYRPEEMPKIDNAILLEKGNYIILAICPDSGEAQRVLEDL